MSERIRIKRMTPAMRIIHWLTVIAVVTCIVTGYYIAYPYYQAQISVEPAQSFVMAWNRWAHFIGAIVLDVLAIWVIYLYFFSRFDKPYKKLIPSRNNTIEYFQVLYNLITLNRKPKVFDTHHSDSFNIVNFAILHILLILMLFTGLQLYVHGFGSGHSAIGAWWPWILHLATDWTLWAFDGKVGVRVAHHALMYAVMAWVMLHIYYQIWRTIFWREGDINIVFGGEKFARKRSS